MEIFNCPYKCGDSCLEGSGKLADETKRMIMDEYRLQAIYQFTEKWETRFKYFQIIMSIQSIAIFFIAVSVLLSQLR